MNKKLIKEPIIQAHYICAVIVNPEKNCDLFEKCLKSKSEKCLWGGEMLSGVKKYRNGRKYK
jgi:hypothetical protein